jgi:hypothetical protein
MLQIPSLESSVGTLLTDQATPSAGGDWWADEIGVSKSTETSASPSTTGYGSTAVGSGDFTWVFDHIDQHKITEIKSVLLSSPLFSSPFSVPLCFFSFLPSKQLFL